MGMFVRLRDRLRGYSDDDLRETYEWMTVNGSVAPIEFAAAQAFWFDAPDSVVDTLRKLGAK